MSEVHKPAHYQIGGVETIDVIRAKLGSEGFGYYCEGNAIKYLTRWRLKGGVQDLEKAQVYLDWLIVEQKLAGHVAGKPQIPPHVAEVIAAAEDGDDEPGALKAGEAYRGEG